jgi:Uma2 family endonuclease
MIQPLKKEATYEDLHRIPENMVGEIIEGDLYALPRPSFRHSNVETGLAEIRIPYQYGRGGPGGWVILVEPEIKFDKNLLVPDLAGWKKKRLPQPPETNWTRVVPDWICEILSPNSIRIDRVKKMNVYLQNAVPYVWLVDPAAETLEVFRLENDRWSLVLAADGDEKVRAEPFHEIEIELIRLWWR